MKRFHFPLETLLRIARYRQRLAEWHQGRAFRQWWQARQQLLALYQHGLALSYTAAERLHRPEHAPPDGPGKVGVSPACLASPHAAVDSVFWFLLSEHVSVLHRIEELARSQEAHERQVWEQAQQQRLAATRQVETLQWLRNQALAAFRRELGLYEQQARDEAALRAWSPTDSHCSSTQTDFPLPVAASRLAGIPDYLGEGEL
ncbi:hypothetical protein HRbin36_00483 [bacterium HR36]|nr:hypothetical protein HRbin36_00483 [bacterium HR36]